MSDCRHRENNNGTVTVSILIRYLSLVHGTNEGAIVLMPSNEHQAVLRDQTSAAEIPLHGARIRLLDGDGKALTGSKTKLTRNGVVPRMSDILGSETESVKPKGHLVGDAGPIGDLLCAQVTLPGGGLTGYPPSAFPEHAEKEHKIGALSNTKLTDTLLYTTTLEAGEYQLQVQSPRCHVSLRFSRDARFEIANHDQRRGELTNNRDSKEWNILKGLLEGFDDHVVTISTDDIWPCPTASTGDFA